jgi:hypothetical protein
VFTAESLGLIEKSFREVAQKMDFQILEFNGEDDALIDTKRATLPLRVRQFPTEGNPPAGLDSPNQAVY